jgi:translation initiation factor 1 (eIF-1/SUI1)
MENIQQNNQQNILNEFDKKVILKYKKIKGKNKTNIYGLEKILENCKLDEFLKKIKKKLGCGGIITVDDDKIYIIEFMGDHRLKIKQILIDEKIVSEDKIEMKGA